MYIDRYLVAHIYHIYIYIYTRSQVFSLCRVSKISRCTTRAQDFSPRWPFSTSRSDWFAWLSRCATMTESFEKKHGGQNWDETGQYKRCPRKKHLVYICLYKPIVHLVGQHLLKTRCPQKLGWSSNVKNLWTIDPLFNAFLGNDFEALTGVETASHYSWLCPPWPVLARRSTRKSILLGDQMLAANQEVFWCFKMAWSMFRLFSRWWNAINKCGLWGFLRKWSLHVARWWMICERLDTLTSRTSVVLDTGWKLGHKKGFWLRVSRSSTSTYWDGDLQHLSLKMFKVLLESVIHWNTPPRKYHT